MIINNNITDTGIYEIKCTITNKVYIGSSKHMTRRLREHVNELRKQKHCNSCLQGVWNKYGENSFICNCIENLDPNISYDELLLIEQTYLDKIQPWKRDIGFNLSKIANRPPYLKGEAHPMYGKNHTEEAKAKMRVPRPGLSAANKGKTMSERLGREWINPLIGTTRDGWVSPCKGKKRTDWVSPCKILTPVTLKHTKTMELCTKLPNEWYKLEVSYKKLLTFVKTLKTSQGWFFCPHCCTDNKNSECICSLASNVKQFSPITLKHEDGTVLCLTSKEWSKKKVYALDLAHGRQKTSRGWSFVSR
jgi:group I intron endonuclease